MRRLLIAIAAIAAVVGCTKQEAQEGQGYALFTSAIESRAVGDKWESDDKIGVMVTSENDIVDDYKYNCRYNVSFTDDATKGTFTAHAAADKIYYSIDEDTMIDFYAYYPYRADLDVADQQLPISVVNQTTPKNIDFMEASTRGDGGYNKNSSAVALSFNRKMAKITLKLKAGTGLKLTDITAVKLCGFYTEANYIFPTNEFDDFDGEDVDITPYVESAAEYIYSAILIPEQATSHKVYFVTKLGDVPLDLTSEALAAGAHKYYTVTVNQTEATFDENVIDGWDSVPGDDIENE